MTWLFDSHIHLYAIGQIHDTIQGKPTQQTGRGSAVQSPTSVSAAGFNELAERQTPSRNANE